MWPFLSYKEGPLRRITTFGAPFFCILQVARSYMRGCSIELLRKSSQAPLIARRGLAKAKRAVVKQRHGNDISQSTILASQRRPSRTALCAESWMWASAERQVNNNDTPAPAYLATAIYFTQFLS
jgi:hypothetical protein